MPSAQVRSFTKVLAIANSLRHGSFNRMALRAARHSAPAGMSIEEADIAEGPLYNDDIHRAGDPPAVADLRAKRNSADALLLVSPEYNFSIPRILKNVLDWVSRPPNALDGMPVAIQVYKCRINNNFLLKFGKAQVRHVELFCTYL